MTRLRVFLLAVVASVAVASGAGRAQGQAQGQAPPQGPTFKTGTQLVPVYVTVTDPERHLVADLIKDDFDVLDNGKPVPIVLFDAEVQPISVVTMLDTSGSMTGSLDLLKAAAEQFLIRLLPHDRGMVGAFNDKIQFVSPLTSDRDDLVSSLQDIGFGNPHASVRRNRRVARTAQADRGPARRAHLHGR